MEETHSQFFPVFPTREILRNGGVIEHGFCKAGTSWAGGCGVCTRYCEDRQLETYEFCAGKIAMAVFGRRLWPLPIQ